MSSLSQHRSPIQRQLEAYEESWQRDHRAAMACRDLEDTISVGIAIFHLLKRAEDLWRDRVFRGVEEFADEDDRWMQSLFRSWLHVTEDVLKAVPDLEARFGSVDGAEELRECATGATSLLAGWQPPRLARAIGLREQTLTPEAAAELNRLAKDAQSNPPAIPTRRLPTEDPSFLLKRSC
ncbi:MAG TPA: hypothetical protein VH682_14890 [Gemmataceae bacterium]